MTATEYVILVDEHDRETGRAEKLEAHAKSLLHRAFSVFIFRDSPRRELLLQQRALGKYHSPGLWTNTCCSHPRPGEEVIAAGERRLREELGISTTLRSMGSFLYHAPFDNGLCEHEVDHVLVGTVPQDVQIISNEDEIHAWRWVTLEDLRDELAAQPQAFTPWLKQALELAARV